MEGKRSQEQKPDPKRLAALRSLPKEIIETLTKEEVKAFLREDVWPDSLGEKLKDFIVDEDQ